ncbi:NAD-dependent epimerase/dehydratase family protein [Cohnella fermenti]|uniref:SDR family oxidoreductase n=1 Tax=Cohnella fermenti TaxID=2565925 RepID=A0A4V3WE53_9BACL|nr:SDR family oxidoreductase [Cohnella fermenti]THF74899.1 SDR family oxidoreductase [Cohnella fermenti]
METVLVTGAGGYIGSVLVPMLLRQGYRVKAIDRFFFGADTLAEHPKLERIREDARRLTLAHFENVDAVIDLVAISNDPSGEYFAEETYEINYLSRVNTAKLAKLAGAARYILPSSCSLYGFQEQGVIVDERSPTNPLTTYARANELAEKGVLELADWDYTVVILRQATVYGYSPRMRFDLAVNSMTIGAWENGVVPLNRDGRQWRPFVHVQDTATAMCLMLKADSDNVNGEIFNVGSQANNYQLGRLAAEVAAACPGEVKIEWVGDADFRSYRVNCDKLARVLNWAPSRTVTDGVREIYDALFTGRIARSVQTSTLMWYQELSKWHRIIKDIELHGGILRL